MLDESDHDTSGNIIGNSLIRVDALVRLLAVNKSLMI